MDRRHPVDCRHEAPATADRCFQALSRTGVQWGTDGSQGKLGQGIVCGQGPLGDHRSPRQAQHCSASPKDDRRGARHLEGLAQEQVGRSTRSRQEPNGVRMGPLRVESPSGTAPMGSRNGNDDRSRSRNCYGSRLALTRRHRMHRCACPVSPAPVNVPVTEGYAGTVSVTVGRLLPSARAGGRRCGHPATGVGREACRLSA